MRRITLLLSFLCFVCTMSGQRDARFTSLQEYFTSPRVSVDEAVGKYFVYNNLYEYNMENAPCSYSRAGWKSVKANRSRKEFNEYVRKLKGYKNRIYRLAEVIDLDPTDPDEPKGFVLVHEDGDTMLYSSVLFRRDRPCELIRKEVLDAHLANFSEARKLVDNQLVFLGSPCEPIDNLDNPYSQEPAFLFRNKTNPEELRYDLPVDTKVRGIPVYSIWTVVDVTFDHDCFKHNRPDIFVDIKNSQFGTFTTTFSRHFEELGEKSVNTFCSRFKLFDYHFYDRTQLVRELRNYLDEWDSFDTEVYDKQYREIYNEFKKSDNQIDEEEERQLTELVRKKENFLKFSETLYNLSTGGIHCETYNNGFEVLNIKEVVFGGFHPLEAPVIKTFIDESGKHKVKTIDSFSQSVNSFLHDLLESLEKDKQF